MKRVATAAVAGLIALASFVGTTPAYAADGYGGATVVIKLIPNEKTVHEGKSFDFDFKAETSTGHNVHCITHTFKFNGHSNQSGTFTAPQVSSNTDRPISITCSYEEDDLVTLGGGGGRLSTSFATAIQSQSDSGVVHILNRGGNKHHDDDDHHGKKNKDDDDDNGNLPNTGGERLAWLVIGLLLVAAGSTVVVSSRKRDTVA
jgi:LPXTG-motif cell wall-anchored protein